MTETSPRQEHEVVNGRLAFFMVKGDLSRETIGKDPSIVPNSTIAENKVRAWLSTSLEEYADKVCGIKIKVVETKIIKGLNKDQLVELYGKEHSKWMDSLSKEDLKKQVSIYDGSTGPLVLAIVRVDGTTSYNDAEKKLTKVRDSFRGDWHRYLGKKEVRLPGGSSMYLSAIHVGNYEEAKPIFGKFGLNEHPEEN